MRTRGAFLLFFAALPTAMAAPPAPVPGAAFRLSLPAEEYKLPNGLRVVLSRDNASPVIAACVLYNVGTRTEDKGHLGYAQLFEQLMDKAPGNGVPGDFEKYLRANGGRMTSSARPGYSLLTLLAASNQLAPALWMEAGRMHSLPITAETLKLARDAIRKQREETLVSYAEALVEGWPALVFSNPQNTHSLLGTVRDAKGEAAASDDISAATVEEVTKFYRTWYTPNNAVLVIAGDFQIADAKKLVDQYFGPISSQPLPQRPDVSEPPRTQGKMQSFQDTRVGVPAVVIGWQSPVRRSPPWYGLQMLDAVLTTGLTARLPSNLVQGRQSLVQFQSGIGFPVDNALSAGDPAEYSIFALYKPGLRAQLILSELQGEIDGIAILGVNADLPRIKAALRVKRTSQMQSALERGVLLGEYELLDGKLSFLDDDFVMLMSVSPDDVQAVARRLLTANRRDVMLIDPAPKPAGARQ